MSMSTALRIVLIASAMGTMVYFLWQIRKNRLQIVYAISWSLFSIVLVALSLFPQILSFFANLLGVVSPTNPAISGHHLHSHSQAIWRHNQAVTNGPADHRADADAGAQGSPASDRRSPERLRRGKWITERCDRT